MPNNYGPLQSSGPISLEDIANVFFLYQAYQAGGVVDMSDYYGDKVKWYVPPTPIIPSTGNPLKISDFYGKRYGLIVNVIVSSPVSNFNLYDAADNVAHATYGLRLNDPRNIPFLITLTNNSTISSPAGQTTRPALFINTGSNGATFNQFTSIAVVNNGTIVGATATGGARSDNYGGSTSWTVPAGVFSITANVVGGGGGGGSAHEKGNGQSGGGGGSGGHSRATFATTPGQGVGIGVGGGGRPSGSPGRGNQASGGSGGGSSVSVGGQSVSAGGGGGGSGGGWAGGGGSGNVRNGNSGGGGQSGSNDRDSRGGGGGGGSVYAGWGSGGAGAGFQDRSGDSWSGAGGGAGGVNLSYTINLPGGDAILTRRPTQIVNNGVISGGVSSIGTSGTYGSSVNGASLVLNRPIGGSVIGSQIN